MGVHLHRGLCHDYLQLLISPLQELNFLIVLLLLYLPPLVLPLLRGLALCLLLIDLPLQVSLFCFQFCNLRTEPQSSWDAAKRMGWLWGPVEGPWNTAVQPKTLPGSVLPPSGRSVPHTAYPRGDNPATTLTLWSKGPRSSDGEHPKRPEFSASMTTMCP